MCVNGFNIILFSAFKVCTHHRVYRLSVYWVMTTDHFSGPGWALVLVCLSPDSNIFRKWYATQTLLTWFTVTLSRSRLKVKVTSHSWVQAQVKVRDWLKSGNALPAWSLLVRAGEESGRTRCRRSRVRSFEDAEIKSIDQTPFELYFAPLVNTLNPYSHHI